MSLKKKLKKVRKNRRTSHAAERIEIYPDSEEDEERNWVKPAKVKEEKENSNNNEGQLDTESSTSSNREAPRRRVERQRQKTNFYGNIVMVTRMSNATEEDDEDNQEH